MVSLPRHNCRLSGVTGAGRPLTVTAQIVLSHRGSFWAADELTGSPIVDQAAAMDHPKALLLKHLWIYATTRRRYASPGACDCCTDWARNSVLMQRECRARLNHARSLAHQGRRGLHGRPR
jgi:hypothetical protein